MKYCSSCYFNRHVIFSQILYQFNFRVFLERYQHSPGNIFVAFVTLIGRIPQSPQIGKRIDPYESHRRQRVWTSIPEPCPKSLQPQSLTQDSQHLVVSLRSLFHSQSPVLNFLSQHLLAFCRPQSLSSGPNTNPSDAVKLLLSLSLISQSLTLSSNSQFPFRIGLVPNPLLQSLESSVVWGSCSLFPNYCSSCHGALILSFRYQCLVSFQLLIFWCSPQSYPVSFQSP